MPLSTTRPFPTYITPQPDGRGGRARRKQLWSDGGQGRLPVKPRFHARLEQPHVPEPNGGDERHGE